MPRQTERPDQSSTLPPPELNPLLNPLLAQNMGRWADVYFANPPEKREQAVLDLLRELRAEGSLHENSLGDQPLPAAERAAQMNSAFQTSRVPPAATEPERVRCTSCGRELPATQKYCGMCGTRQQQSARPTRLGALDSAIVDSATRNQPIEDWADQESSSFVRPESQYVPPEPARFEPESTNGLSLFQASRDDSDRYSSRYDNEEIFSYPATSRPYRLYVGAALAIIIAALGYMAWRSAQATSDSSRGALPSAPAATQAAPATTTPPDPTSNDTEDKMAANKQAAPSQNAAAASENTAAKAPAKAVTSPAPKPNPTNQSQPETATGHGAEELAIAQSYLQGTNGKPRDGAEAAKWLWKSMSKHNATATVLLADLYLNGDGVSKNCDQAHVLLDSAARAGAKEAAEQLQHLQTFGCD